MKSKQSGGKSRLVTGRTIEAKSVVLNLTMRSDTLGARVLPGNFLHRGYSRPVALETEIRLPCNGLGSCCCLESICLHRDATRGVKSKLIGR